MTGQQLSDHGVGACQFLSLTVSAVRQYVGLTPSWEGFVTDRRGASLPHAVFYSQSCETKDDQLRYLHQKFSQNPGRQVKTVWFGGQIRNCLVGPSAFTQKQKVQKSSRMAFEGKAMTHAHKL